MEDIIDVQELPEGEIKYAGFLNRFLALLIDAIILGIVHVPLYYISFNQNTYSWLTIIVAWLYFAYLESSENQATLGKMALSIKVTDLKGERISFGRATGRYFSKYISFIIFLFGFDCPS